MADLQYALCIDAKWHIRKPQPMPKGMLQSMSMACASNGLLQPFECLDLCTAAKTARWSTLYYGQLPYLVTFAAAKTQIQFYIIERGNVAHPKAVGPKIMLETVSGRVRLLLAAVNLHKMMRAVESYLPQEVLPVDQPQVSLNNKGYIREL